MVEHIINNCDNSKLQTFKNSLLIHTEHQEEMLSLDQHTHTHA